jgi:chromosome segregation ATPase
VQRQKRPNHLHPKPKRQPLPAGQLGRTEHLQRRPCACHSQHRSTRSSATTNSQQNDVQRAQEELAQAQKNLEAGRQVRYGNERNYARYQQRIQGLEQAVQNARQKLEQAQGGQIAD